MDADPQRIEHLDFQPGPLMCGCRGCPAVPHVTSDPPCSGVATHCVVVHAVNDCGKPELTPGGGLSQLVCDVCLLARTRRAEVYAGRLQRYFGRFGRPVVCSTCGRPLVEVSDFLEVRRVTDS